MRMNDWLPSGSSHAQSQPPGRRAARGGRPRGHWRERA